MVAGPRLMSRTSAPCSTCWSAISAIGLGVALLHRRADGLAHDVDLLADDDHLRASSGSISGVSVMLGLARERRRDRAQRLGELGVYSERASGLRGPPRAPRRCRAACRASCMSSRASRTNVDVLGRRGPGWRRRRPRALRCRRRARAPRARSARFACPAPRRRRRRPRPRRCRGPGARCRPPCRGSRRRRARRAGGRMNALRKVPSEHMQPEPPRSTVPMRSSVTPSTSTPHVSTTSETSGFSRNMPPLTGARAGALLDQVVHLRERHARRRCRGVGTQRGGEVRVRVGVDGDDASTLGGPQPRQVRLTAWSCPRRPCRRSRSSRDHLRRVRPRRARAARGARRRPP